MIFMVYYCWLLLDSFWFDNSIGLFCIFSRIKIIEQHHDPKQGVKCCSEQFGGEHINLALWLFEIQFHKHYHITTHYHTTSITHIHPLQKYYSTKKCYNDDNVNLHWSLIWYRVLGTLLQLWLTFEMFYFIFLLISSNSNLHVTFPLLLWLTTTHSLRIGKICTSTQLNFIMLYYML